MHQRERRRAGCARRPSGSSCASVGSHGRTATTTNNAHDAEPEAPAAAEIADRHRQPGCRSRADRQGGRVERGHRPDAVGEVLLDQRRHQHVGDCAAGQGEHAQQQERPDRSDHRAGDEAHGRASPAMTTSNRCGPNLTDSRGATAPRPAKQTTGSVVITPATPLLVCSPCSMSSSTAPTLVTAVRIEKPVRARAATSSHARRGHMAPSCPSGLRRTPAGRCGVRSASQLDREIDRRRAAGRDDPDVVRERGLARGTAVSCDCAASCGRRITVRTVRRSSRVGRPAERLAVQTAVGANG